jgi:nicotinate phosphoribosyltransferase
MDRKRIGPLFTDLYELTMAAGYHARGMAGPATFSVFVRGGKRSRHYLVAAGLAEVLAELAALRFSPEEIDYLRGLDRFSDDFLAYLTGFRFTGQVHAMAEGTIFFPDEPIMEVTAPLIEAQIIETFVLNTLGFQTLIATKAARCMHAAAGRPLIDFSLRRTQGVDAGMKVARSAFIAGFEATSNVLAAKAYGIPVSGTMAHSFVTAFDREVDAFSAYAETFPDETVLLIDTYDVQAGAENALEIARMLKAAGKALVGIRLDSGDMAAQSIAVRDFFDRSGFPDVKIFASSGFDEFKIADTLIRGGRIDAFGVGTKMGVSADAPFLDIVYKMVRYAGRNVCKFSSGKTTLAGKKQVFRRSGGGGAFVEDIVGTREETIDGAEALLAAVMANGQPIGSPPPLKEIRRRFADQFACLEDAFKAPDRPAVYPVSVSRRLSDLQP